MWYMRKDFQIEHWDRDLLCKTLKALKVPIGKFNAYYLKFLLLNKFDVRIIKRKKQYRCVVKLPEKK